MSRGLALVEAVGLEPGTVSDLARRLALDKAVVSRLVASAEEDGWLVRRDGLVVLGPRSAALGRTSEARGFERLADELAHALAGVTGFDVTVVQYAGDRGHVLAFSRGQDSLVTETDYDPFPLLTTAIGLTLAAQLPDAQLDRLLSVAPVPRTERTITDPAAIRARIDEIRGGVLAREDREFDPGAGCVATSWRHPSAVAPTSIAVIGPADRVDAAESLIRRVLSAAASPGARRATVVAAAASTTPTGGPPA
jgi:DNA-binding IclR family transcriptional regulator